MPVFRSSLSVTGYINQSAGPTGSLCAFGGGLEVTDLMQIGTGFDTLFYEYGTRKADGPRGPAYVDSLRPQDVVGPGSFHLDAHDVADVYVIGDPEPLSIYLGETAAWVGHMIWIVNYSSGGPTIITTNFSYGQVLLNETVIFLGGGGESWTKLGRFLNGYGTAYTTKP